MHATIVALDAYPLLDPSVREGIGGAEVRAMTFARGLRDQHDVTTSILVKHRAGIPTELSGFQVVPYTKPKVPALRKWSQSIRKRFSHTPPHNAFFSKLSTDVLLCFGVRNDTASMIRSAKAVGTRCAVFLTSDRNIEDAMRSGRKDRGVYGELGHFCRYALEQADLIVAQTPYQCKALSDHLGLEASLIRNPIELSSNVSTETTNAGTDAPVLWIGRADTFSKRANLCLEIARRCPKRSFQMVMNNHDTSTFSQLRQQAPHNVQVVEQVPFEEIGALFQASRLLLNTSAAEGFPNAFLQAAKFGKPIVSLSVDPGSMLTEHGCGAFGEDDVQKTAALVETLCKDQASYSTLSQQAKEYVHRFHDAKQRCVELYNALENLVFDSQRSVA